MARGTIFAYFFWNVKKKGVTQGKKGITQSQIY